LGRRRAVPTVARVQGAREGAGRVVADDDPRLDSTLLERLGLQLRVLVDGPPEGPGERHDDADLHPVGVYERATKARALRAGRALAVSVSHGRRLLLGLFLLEPADQLRDVGDLLLEILLMLLERAQKLLRLREAAAGAAAAAVAMVVPAAMHVTSSPRRDVPGTARSRPASGAARPPTSGARPGRRR